MNAPNKSLQATRDGRSVFDGVGHSLLSGFAGVLFLRLCLGLWTLCKASITV